MSRRPGIGKAAVQVFAQSVLQNQGAAVALSRGWVPQTFMVGKSKFPMDRFIKEGLYAQLKITKKQRQAVNEEIVLKLWAMKSSMSTDQYERERKARVDQQEGRIGLERKKPL